MSDGSSGLPPKALFLLLGPVTTLVLFLGIGLTSFEGQLQLYVFAGGLGFVLFEYILIDQLYKRW